MPRTTTIVLLLSCQCKIACDLIPLDYNVKFVCVQYVYVSTLVMLPCAGTVVFMLIYINIRIMFTHSHDIAAGVPVACSSK